MSDIDIGQLHRDLGLLREGMSVQNATLARIEEQLKNGAATHARMEAGMATLDHRVDELRSRLDKAEGAVALLQWFLGLGGAGVATGGAMVYQALQSTGAAP